MASEALERDATQASETGSRKAALEAPEADPAGDAVRTGPGRRQVRIQHRRGCPLHEKEGSGLTRLVQASRTPDSRRRSLIIIATLTGSFALMRLWLHNWPHADFDLAGYNIHHLFTGLLLVVAGGIPLAVLPRSSRGLDWACAVFALGLALALDECVYLIVTDGSNAAYLLPASFWGGAIMIGLACLYTWLMVTLGRRS